MASSASLTLTLSAFSVNPRFFSSHSVIQTRSRRHSFPPNSLHELASPAVPVPSLRQTSRLTPSAVAEETAPQPPLDPSSEAARRLYIGNIPRTLDDEELTSIIAEHGAVERAQVMYDKYSGRSRRFAFVTMKSVEDANVVIEKLNGTQIGGREIKVNITKKPLPSVDISLLEVQAEDSEFIDSPFKVYVGNLAKTVTTNTLKKFFSEEAKVISAKVSRVPGTSKSSGFGFVTFSSQDDVEAAIVAFNNSLLEGQQIRVNKA